MNHSIYRQIYTQMERLGILNRRYRRVLVRGYMPLTVEAVGPNLVSIAHYYETNGDLIPDPDMVVRYNDEARVAEAMSYQDSFGYRAVYRGHMIDVRAKRELNSFLLQWLHNLIAQGFADGEVVRDERLHDPADAARMDADQHAAAA